MKKIYQSLLPLLIGAYFNLLSYFSKEHVAKLAFTLFVTPRKGKILPFQASYLEEAKHEWIKVGGKRIKTYQWAGSRETVLLVHGWESNSFRWKNLIRFLKEEGYGILAFDAPAHGHSSGSILNIMLYAECTNHAVTRYKPDYIIGHSMGGMTAVYHQYLYPDTSLKKIVTIGAPSDLYDIMLQYQKIVRFNNRVLQALDSYYKMHFGFGIHDFSTANYAKDIRIPGLIIHDELDTIAPVTASEKVHSAWEKSHFIRTTGLGHSMHQEEVNEEIIRFLKS